MPIPELAEAKGPEEDWTGLKDAKQRKKLQNRLNLRAHRKRKACLTAATSSTDDDPAAKLPGPNSLFLPRHHSQAYCAAAGKTSVSPKPLRRSFVQINSPGSLFQYISSLAKRGEAQDHLTQAPKDNSQLSRLTFPLSRDHLLPLVQYNIMRAARILEPTDAVLRTTRSAQLSRPDATAAFDATPGMDLLPHPRMRDNAILNQNNFDAAELEDDLFGEVCNDEAQLHGVDPGEMRGLLVWSDPWRPEGWEVTEGFVRKWDFLVRGCDSMFSATNRWRASRGEKPLVVRY